MRTEESLFVWQVGDQQQLLGRGRCRNGVTGDWRGCEMGEGERVELNNSGDFWQWRVTVEPKLETMNQDHFYVSNQSLCWPLLNADLVLLSKSVKIKREAGLWQKRNQNLPGQWVLPGTVTMNCLKSRTRQSKGVSCFVWAKFPFVPYHSGEENTFMP